MLQNFLVFFCIAFTSLFSVGFKAGMDYRENESFLYNQLINKSLIYSLRGRQCVAISTIGGRVYGYDVFADSVIKLDDRAAAIDGAEARFLIKKASGYGLTATVLPWAIPPASFFIQKTFNPNIALEVVDKREKILGSALGGILGLSLGYLAATRLDLLQSEEGIEDKYFGNAASWRNLNIKIVRSLVDRKAASFEKDKEFLTTLLLVSESEHPKKFPPKQNASPLTYTLFGIAGIIFLSSIVFIFNKFRHAWTLKRALIR